MNVDPQIQQLHATAVAGGTAGPAAPGNQYLTATITASYDQRGDTLQVQASVQPKDASAALATLMVGVVTPGSGGNQGSYGFVGPNGNVPSMEWVGLLMLEKASSQLGPQSQGFATGYVLVQGAPQQYYFSQPVTPA